MQKYVFSMEKVLDWRSDLEGTAQQVVKEKQEIVRLEEEKLKRMTSESRKLKSEKLFYSSIDNLKRHNLYKEVLNDKITQQRLNVEKANQDLVLAMDSLKEAHKDKKVMEKLEEKEHTRYVDLLKKKEQDQLDEISTLSYGRSFT
ncbi:flagellar export protein FliJ [Alkalibacterium sp. MB6]|uniref:flagellar export protein FliJ n=1 Tax=Alkalibacterium sp. MB6 TaxID=2081965 RepID=UPI00137A6D0F|nr:flagellar export protein FliJ [Alkalibacterium sp. MB6]